MGLSAKVGSFSVDTAKTAGQTQAVSGVGFQPKVVLFWMSGRTGTGDSVGAGHANRCFGVAISSSARRCILAIENDDQADTNTARMMRDDACFGAFLADTTAVEGLLDLQSMDSDGFTLIVDDQFATAWRVHYLALGGDDLTDYQLGSYQYATAIGSRDITVGFQPDALIQFGAAYTALNTRMYNSYFSIGWTTAAGAEATEQYAQGDVSADSQATSYHYSFLRGGESFIQCEGGEPTASPSYHEEVTAWLSNGFTLYCNEMEGVPQNYAFYLALKGANFFAGDLATLTNTTTDITETVGFQPAAVLFMSANHTEHAEDTADDHTKWTFGAVDGSLNQAAAAVYGENGLATTEVATAIEHDNVYIHVVDDAVTGAMNVTSISASGFVCRMTDADPSGCFVTYLAIGPVASAGATLSINVAPENTAYLVAGVKVK